MADPTSSYATAGIALRILEALKLPHPDLPLLRQSGDVIEGENIFSYARIVFWLLR
jgi:hypothetical protein